MRYGLAIIGAGAAGFAAAIKANELEAGYNKDELLRGVV